MTRMGQQFPHVHVSAFVKGSRPSSISPPVEVDSSAFAAYRLWGRSTSQSSIVRCARLLKKALYFSPTAPMPRHCIYCGSGESHLLR